MMIKTKFAKRAFTLAEVLITLAIIGVVAAMTIPAVIVNTNQMEFKTGLRKAVSVLNSAITMNKALTGESPYDNSQLFNYLQQHMAVMRSTGIIAEAGDINAAFYTTDGMRYEVSVICGTNSGKKCNFPLYESNNKAIVEFYEAGDSGSDVHTITAILANDLSEIGGPGCGSKGLAHNPDGTTKVPCIITVDVNGDRKPSPSKYYFLEEDDWVRMGKYNFQKSDAKLLTDVFSIMITDQGAIPYGIAAQKAMYQAQK